MEGRRRTDDPWSTCTTTFKSSQPSIIPEGQYDIAVRSMSDGPPARLPPLPPPRGLPALPTTDPKPASSPSKEAYYQWSKPEYSEPPPPCGISDEMLLEGHVEGIYTLGKFLGSGGFAEVYEAVHNSTKELFAIKVIDKVLAMEGDPEAIKLEVQIMKSLNHPNIVKFIEAYETPFRVYIVMERLGEPLVSSSDLKNSWVPLKESVLKSVTTQILGVLCTLHSSGIIHRDIKPENMLWERSSTSTIKLIDFGMAVHFPQSLPLTQWVGTTEFQSPEMVSQNPSGYDYSVDMWSLGISLYYLVTGKYPFADKNRMIVILKIKKGEYVMNQDEWNLFDPSLQDFVKNLLSADPSLRMKAETALNHPWLLSK